LYLAKCAAEVRPMNARCRRLGRQRPGSRTPSEGSEIAHRLSSTLHARRFRASLVAITAGGSQPRRSKPGIYAKAQINVSEFHVNSNSCA